MHIRRLTISDAENFLALNKKLDDSGFMLHDPGERKMKAAEQRRALVKLNDDASTIFYVAEESDRLLGFIAAFRGTLNRNRHRASLVVGVDEAYRGKGIATRLFQKIFRWSRDNNLLRLELTVIENNMPALRLYRKMGFKVEGEKVQSLKINGKMVNELYMYKLL